MATLPRVLSRQSIETRLAALEGAGVGGGGGGAAATSYDAGFGAVGFGGDPGRAERLTIPANGFKDVPLHGGGGMGGFLMQSVYQNDFFPEPNLIVAGPGQASELHVGISRALIQDVQANPDSAAVRDRYRTVDVAIRIALNVSQAQDGTVPVIGLGDLLVTVTRSYFDSNPAAKFILVDRHPIAATGADEVVLSAIPIYAPGAPSANGDQNAYLSIRIYNTTANDIQIASGYDNYMAGLRSAIVARAFPSN